MFIHNVCACMCVRVRVESCELSHFTMLEFYQFLCALITKTERKWFKE